MSSGRSCIAVFRLVPGEAQGFVTVRECAPTWRKHYVWSVSHYSNVLICKWFRWSNRLSEVRERPRFIRRPLARFGLFIDPASAGVCVRACVRGCVCRRVALRCVMAPYSGQLSPCHILLFFRSVTREWETLGRNLVDFRKHITVAKKKNWSK